MTQRTASLGVALCLSAAILSWSTPRVLADAADRDPGGAAGPGGPAGPGGQVALVVPAWSGSKAGVFVLAAPAADGGTDLATLSASLAGVNVALLTEGSAPPGTIAVRDADGSLKTRYALAPGSAVALRADGTEIGRFGSGATASTIADAIEASRRAKVGEYNLPKRSGPALSGYDAVSYFEPSGPQKGSAAFASRYRGVTYHFANADRRAAFNADPERYLPTYGGWCATAMAEGDKVEIDPTNYKVTNGRLFLFYRGFLGNAKKDWDKNEKGLEQRADANWVRIAGEPATKAP